VGESDASTDADHVGEFFGLWRARLISNRLFAAGVACVVLSLLNRNPAARTGW
jgi:hypothetical protein